jgi:hypothetical protein
MAATRTTGRPDTLTNAEPLLGPRVAGMLARYGFATLEEIAAVPDLGLLGTRHVAPAAIPARAFTLNSRLLLPPTPHRHRWHPPISSLTNLSGQYT